MFLLSLGLCHYTNLFDVLGRCFFLFTGSLERTEFIMMKFILVASIFINGYKRMEDFFIIEKGLILIYAPEMVFYRKI